jgi:hypothetical protein
VLRVSSREEPVPVVVRPAPAAMVAPRPGGLPAYEIQLPNRILHVAPTRTLGGMLLEVGGWLGGCLIG